MDKIIANVICIFILSTFGFEITVGMWLTSTFVTSFSLMCPEEMDILINHVSLPIIACSLGQQKNQIELTIKPQLSSTTKMHNPQINF